MHSRSLLQSLFRLILVISAFASFDASAAIAYRWKVTDNGGSTLNNSIVGSYQSTGAAICEATRTAHMLGGSTCGYSGSVSSGSPSSAGLGGGVRACAGSCTVYVSVVSESYEAAGGSCNSSAAGQTFMITGTSGYPGGNVCDTNTGCRAESQGLAVILGNGSWGGTYKVTTQQCTAGAGQTAVSNKKTEETCIQGASGMNYCGNSTGTSNCGFINDSYVCLKTDVKEDTCKALGDGSRVCGQNAGTPPVPDNGTRGVKATPSDTIAGTQAGAGGGTGTTTNYNYYNSTTVNGSARDPSAADGSSDSSGNSSSGSSSSASSGEASGGSDCVTPPSCTGDSIQCAQLQQLWENRCQKATDAETLAAVGAPTDGSEDVVATTDSDVTEFSAIGFLGAGECLSDMNIDLGDYGTHNVPLSDFCWFFQAFGLVVLAMSYYQGSLIVIGAYK